MPVLDPNCSRCHLNGTAHRCLFHKSGAEWLHSRPFFAPGVADVGGAAKSLLFRRPARARLRLRMFHFGAGTFRLRRPTRQWAHR
jgi:hypothetical protein